MTIEGKRDQLVKIANPGSVTVAEKIRRKEVVDWEAVTTIAGNMFFPYEGTWMCFPLFAYEECGRALSTAARFSVQANAVFLHQHQ